MLARRVGMRSNLSETLLRDGEEHFVYAMVEPNDVNRVSLGDRQHLLHVSLRLSVR